METQLIVAPKNNLQVHQNFDDDMTVCKYITYFLKNETDDKDNIFPGKPIFINKVNSINLYILRVSVSIYCIQFLVKTNEFLSFRKKQIF